jgi:Type III secretion system lipoprotein chaperone (YscW)
VSQLLVRLVAPEPIEGNAATVLRVALFDTSYADALHPTVAAINAPWDASASNELTINVPDGAIDPLHRYSLWAHLDRDGNGRVDLGDLITTANVPVAAVDIVAGTHIDVPLVPI